VADLANIRIRRAMAEDLPGIMALFDELDAYQADWRVFVLRTRHRDDMAESYSQALTDPHSLHLVAESNAELVAMSVGHITRPSSFSDELALEVGSAVVREGHRGRGITTEMVRELAAFGLSQGAMRMSVRVFTGNEGAVGFWRSLGFEDRFVHLTAPLDILLGPSA